MTKTPVQPLCLADLHSRDVDWLWPGRIPIGRLTLLIGDPGVGKSLIALDVAARVSRGANWPDEQKRGDKERGRQAESASKPTVSLSPPLPLSLSPLLRVPPAPVLLLSAEDDLADTIRPRLLAAGADCRLITAIPATRPNHSAAEAHTPLSLSRDLAYLDHVLGEQHGCRLLIIDPISAYVGRPGETFNAEVRRITGRLSDLAARHRLAILAVSHLRKQEGAAIYRAMGSLGWIAAARAAWLVTKDPTVPNRRLMLPLKNNLAAGDTGLACTIETHASPDPNALQNAPPIIRWSPEPIALTPDEAFRPPKRAVGRPSEERDDAARWLQKALAAGPRPSAEIEEEAAAHGIRLVTLRRAFRSLGGEANRIGYGPLGQWHWNLPAIDDQNSPPTLDHL